MFWSGWSTCWPDEQAEGFGDCGQDTPSRRPRPTELAVLDGLSSHEPTLARDPFASGCSRLKTLPLLCRIAVICPGQFRQRGTRRRVADRR